MEYAFRRSPPQSRAFRLAFVALLHGILIYGLLHALRPMVSIKPGKTEIDVVILPVPDRPKPVPEPAKRDPALSQQHRVEVPLPQVPIDIAQPDPPIATSPSDNPLPTAPFVPVESSRQGEGQPVLSVACPNSQAVRGRIRYPLAARRDGLEGDVVARFVVGADGAVRDIVIASSTNRAFNSTVVQAVAQFSCIGQGREVAVEVPFSFRLN